MLMFILIFDFLPVRTTQDTGVLTKRGVCFRPIFQGIDRRTSGYCFRENSSAKNVAKADGVAVRVKRDYRNNSADDQSEIENHNFTPWVEHSDTCKEEQKTNGNVMLFKNPRYILGN
uniref:Uncharacterized protein n=1 Tax=Sipha flava TaxID=143950 RepID=A0A2S2Q5N7_9HEMI